MPGRYWRRKAPRKGFKLGQRNLLTGTGREEVPEEILDAFGSCTIDRGHTSQGKGQWKCISIKEGYTHIRYLMLQRDKRPSPGWSDLGLVHREQRGSKRREQAAPRARRTSTPPGYHPGTNLSQLAKVLARSQPAVHASMKPGSRNNNGVQMSNGELSQANSFVIPNEFRRASGVGFNDRYDEECSTYINQERQPPQVRPKSLFEIARVGERRLHSYGFNSLGGGCSVAWEDAWYFYKTLGLGNTPISSPGTSQLAKARADLSQRFTSMRPECIEAGRE
ncbi:hypothetical protein FB45DRAFT_1137865 [Roridomyces roridus]|uniref:Uncharacterized protein n=1 Tax=Roridomyces roridus TaxID=1738132 RepID=A0AAD7C0Y4_9AGAR|nr:hypothetical protein FB45DRAFT_1137865 [Roridomyces roridus]